jgi:hypothetical protein
VRRFSKNRAPRHCEKRSDQAIQSSSAAYGLLRGACHRAALSLSSGAHSRDPFALTRWLAMTIFICYAFRNQ